MTSKLLLLSVTAFLLASCEVRKEAANGTGQADSAAAPDMRADEEAIRGNITRWLQLVKEKDSAGIAQFYTQDGAVMPPNAPIGKGRSSIEKTWASMMNTPGFDLTFTPDEIVVSSSGDMALDRGTYRLAIAPSGKPQADTGKYVVVWRKVDGEWKAAADIFNSDLPAAGG
jgi:uncharacterized protein (TIGR02246 family)